VRRLVGTTRVLKPSSDLFSKVFKCPPRLRSKTIFMTKTRKLLLELPKFSGAANEWQLLAAREDQTFVVTSPQEDQVHFHLSCHHLVPSAMNFPN
jgi:hypothetical protein